MKNRLSITVAFMSSFLFAVGLGVSGMTQAKYVVGFLDIFGDWQPQLLFVMMGAISIYAPLQKLFSTKKPLISGKFFFPEKKSLDWKLCLGSIMFGIGWGLAGYCPGPSLASLLSWSYQPVVFVIGMIVGIKAFHYAFLKKTE